MLEEEPNADDAGHDDWRGDPAVIKKPMQGAAVSVADRIEEPLDEALGPGFAMLDIALLENARAHQRGEGQ